MRELNPNDKQYRHHQVEAMWIYRNLELVNTELIKELLKCDNHHARAAAAKQLRHWYKHLPNGNNILQNASMDENGLVRMEAAIACSYIGTEDAFKILKEMTKLPNEKHLSYAIITALGSKTMRKFWDPGNVKLKHPEIANMLSKNKQKEIQQELSKKIQNSIVKKIY